MALFVITSRMHGMALDVEGSNTQPGARVIVFPRHGNDNQLWYDDPATGTIRTKINGFCLDIEGDQKLRIMPYQPGDPNQQWERDPQGLIRNRVYRNKVLDIIQGNREAGASIGMFDAHNGPNQLWNFEFVGGSAPPSGYPGQQQYPAGQQYPGQAGYPGQAQYPGQPQYPGQAQYPGQGYPQTGASVQKRYFFIVSEMNGKVLDVKGGASNPGDDIITWSKNGGKNQQWYQDAQGFIRSALKDYAIDGGSGKKVEVQPFNGGPQQQWTFEGKRVVNRSNGEVLDIYGEKNHDGADVGSYRWTDGRNQHWRLEYA